jgi:hypothetical protein
MKRLLILILILILGGFATYKLTKKDPYSTLGKDNDFAVTDTAKISRIFLADRKGNTADLKKIGVWWFVNNKFKVNPVVIESLLKTIFGLETQYRPTVQAAKTMVANLATNAIKVEIYNDKNKPIRVFYIGGVTPDESGTYAIMEGEEQPFVVGVKGKDGGVRVSFFTEEEKWRDKGIFRYKVEDIKSVSIEYPKLKNKSFKLEKTASGYTVEPFYNGVPRSKQKLNTSKVENYLTNFKKQIAEAFENKNPGRDSTIQLLPFCILNVEDIKGAKHEVKLYPIIQTDRDGRMLLDSGKPLQIERYFAYVDNTDLMLVQELVFGKLLWSYDYFFDIPK